MIESAKWSPPGLGESEPNVIVVVEDGVTKNVPNDPANTDYQQVLAWEADGNTIEPFDPPPPPPPQPMTVAELKALVDALEVRVATLEAP